MIRMNDALCKKVIGSGKTETISYHKLSEAIQLKDGLAKLIYTLLFDWLI